MHEEKYIDLARAIVYQARQDYIEALITLDSLEPRVIKAKGVVNEVERAVMGPSMSYLLGGAEPETLLQRWQDEAYQIVNDRKRGRRRSVK